jgi:hypothetical protein
MAKKDTATGMELFKDVAAIFAVNPIIAPQVTQFWQAQDRILDEVEGFSKHWFTRRHTATQTALDVVQDVTGKGGLHPSEAMSAMADWQAHSAERVIADFQEWVDLCSRCVAHVVSAEIKAEKQEIEAVARTITSEVKAKHAMPV